MGFLELRCLNGVSEDVRLGAQGDSLQESGKSGLHARGVIGQKADNPCCSARLRCVMLTCIPAKLLVHKALSE